MNIIQLYVNDDTSLDNTPFVEGPNVIVIPTSLFAETLLNAKIQNQELNQTALFAEGKSKFISIERDGETEEACEEIDFVLVRFDISAEDAMDVLNLLLTCLLDETINETTIAYKFASTKNNGTDAVMMNLPTTALGFVPWLCNYENSPQGRIPHDFGEWLVEKLEEIVNFIIGIFIAIWNAITLIWETIVGFASEVLLDAIPWLGYMLWLLVRAIIFILAWIVFAISFFFMIVLLVLITGIAFLLDTFLDLNISSKIDELIVEGDIELSYRYEITDYYIEFFDLLIPKINSYLNISDFTIEFSISLFSINLEFTEFPTDITTVFDTGPEQSADNSTINYTPLFSNICDLMSGIGLAMAVLGTIVGIQAGLLGLFNKSPHKIAIYLIGLIVFIASIILLIILIFAKPEIFSAWFLLGIGIGCLISAISFFALRKYIKNTFQYKAWFKKTFGGKNMFFLYGILDVIFTSMDVYLGFNDLFGTNNDSFLDKQNKAQFSLGAGIFAIFLSTEAIVFLNKRNRDDKSKLAFLYGGGSFILGCIFIGLAIWKFCEDE